MPGPQVSQAMNVEQLVEAVKHLPPSGLREFERQFTDWKRQNGRKACSEAKLLAVIEENSELPDADHKRFKRLWRKSEAETITDEELIEYQGLIQQLEARNVKRIEALIALAKSRGTTLRGVTTPCRSLGGRQQAGRPLRSFD